MYNRFCFLVSKEKEELEFCLCSFSYIVDRESKRNISSIASFFYHKRRKLSAMPSIYRGTFLVGYLSLALPVRREEESSIASSSEPVPVPRVIE